MSDAFNNFITNKGFGTVLKDYEHANRLYVKDTYARAPKFGFIYYIRFNINRDAVGDKQWAEHDMAHVGLLAKKADLPKFTISTETLNQYNRKTVVQKSLSYSSVNIDLHDDNTDITHLMWANYYKHHFVDGQQGAMAFGDTKYGETDYNYGRYDTGLKNDKFFESIEIYVLHQKNFTKYTLVNPKIKDWKHDSVDQSGGNKILQNSMTVEYETVFYDYGKLSKDSSDYIDLTYYDQTPGPHTSGNDLVYKRGISPFDKPAPQRTYGITNRPGSGDLLTQLGKVVLKNYVNQNGLTRQNATAYNIAGSLLNYTLSSGSGKYAAAGPANEYSEPTANAPGVFNLPGGVGINIFKGFNTSVDGKIRANPASLIFPPKG